MLIAKQLRRGCVVSLIVGAALVPAGAQEAPQTPPAQTKPAEMPQLIAPQLFEPVPTQKPLLFSLDELVLGSVAQGAFQPFPVRPGSPQSPAVTANPQEAGPRTVCGRFVLVDPNIDPRFVIPVPHVGATIRRLEVPPCVPMEAVVTP